MHCLFSRFFFSLCAGRPVSCHRSELHKNTFASRETRRNLESLIPQSLVEIFQKWVKTIFFCFKLVHCIISLYYVFVIGAFSGFKGGSFFSVDNAAVILETVKKVRTKVINFYRHLIINQQQQQQQQIYLP